MYLTAQRVTSQHGDEGINSFYYVHSREWQGGPPSGIPDQDPGVLVGQSVMVPPPGNRVRSYLDLVTSDDASWDEIRPAFITFVSEMQLHPLPWSRVVDRCFFRVGMESALAQQWQREIANLYRAAQTARLG